MLAHRKKAEQDSFQKCLLLKAKCIGNKQNKKHYKQKFTKMKKLILALTIISIIGAGCSKEEDSLSKVVPTKKVRTNQNEVFKTEFGFLKFQNRDIFDRLLVELNGMNEEQLNSWEQGMNFTSLYTMMQNGTEPESNLNKKCPDDLLLRILNKDGIIQIGDYVFKSETDIGLCWTLNQSNLNTNLSDLISRNFISTSMNRFNENLEEDVYDLLSAGTVGVFQDKVRSSTEHKINDDVISNSNVCWRADCKNVYQAAVFYYSLLSELKYMSQANIGWQSVSTSINFENGTKVKFKPRNRSWQGYWSPSLASVNDNKHNWRPYGASRSLTNYEFIGKFKYDSKAPGVTGWRYVNLAIYK